MKNANKSQSVLAKLLSRENITIQHGNYKTAFFDVKNRVLGLPILKDTGKDIYDLFVGHEVGHALYTPIFDPNTFECPIAYINIVEDVRIERMIQTTYPGLIASFRRGYSELVKKNFFETQGRSLDSYKIADRINLHAKIGSTLDIRFDDFEQTILKQVMSVSTWEDVLAAAKALYVFSKQQLNKQTKEESSPTQDDAYKSSSDNSEIELDETPQDTNDLLDSKATTTDGQSSDKSPDENSQNANSEELAEDNLDNDSLEECETVNAFKKNSKSLLEDEKVVNSTVFAFEPSVLEINRNVVHYTTLFKCRDNSEQYLNGTKCFSAEAYKEFMDETERFVSVLRKEFELRKAAYQYSRAKVSKTGILNVDKLHSYRYTDDIFLSTMELANAKNHGMVMFIDYSGSMGQVLKHVLKHVITLCLFCKSVGIPFQVYTFCGNISPSDKYKPIKSEFEKDGTVDISRVIMLDLVNSDMKKSEFQRAIKDLYIRSERASAWSQIENLGDTPLNEAIVMAHKLVPQFQAKYGVQKMNVLFLTDGDGCSLNFIKNDRYNEKTYVQKGYARSLDMSLNGKKFISELHQGDCCEKLLGHLKATTGCNIIGFYIPSTKENTKTRIISALTKKEGNNWMKGSWLWDNKFQYEYRNNKSICIPKVHGYDQYFVVAFGNDLNVQSDELEITENMSRSNMAKQFSKFTKSKKNNRIFATKFAESLS